MNSRFLWANVAKVNLRIHGRSWMSLLSLLILRLSRRYRLFNRWAKQFYAKLKIIFLLNQLKMTLKRWICAHSYFQSLRNAQQYYSKNVKSNVKNCHKSHRSSKNLVARRNLRSLLKNWSSRWTWLLNKSKYKFWTLSGLVYLIVKL